MIIFNKVIIINNKADKRQLTKEALLNNIDLYQPLYGRFTLWNDSEI